MVYDRLMVTLLSLLSTESRGSTNALLADYIVRHASVLPDLSVKELAAACHVGTGTVSRFAREVGFSSFAELRSAFIATSRSFERVTGHDADERASGLADHVTASIRQVEGTLDRKALDRLVNDLLSFENVSVFGLLKGQAAALDLQVDLLMQGKFAYTCTQLSEQVEHVARAGRDELVVVFSYTGTFSEAHDLTEALRRIDRPRIWAVCGGRGPLPDYVADCLSFASGGDRLGHPYQLEYVAGLIAQEYAATQASSAPAAVPRS